MLPRSSGRLCSFSSISILFPPPFSYSSLHTVSRHPHELQIVFVLQLEAVNRCWGPLQQHLRTWVCVCVHACMCVCVTQWSTKGAGSGSTTKKKTDKKKQNQSECDYFRARSDRNLQLKSLGALYYAHTSIDLRTHTCTHTRIHIQQPIHWSTLDRCLSLSFPIHFHSRRRFCLSLNLTQLRCRVALFIITLTLTHILTLTLV